MAFCTVRDDLGTPSFMAPEQAAGRRVTPATDIFALGQVAAYAATGSPAFGEGTSHGVLCRIVHEEPDLTAVPERLTELVTRCLTKEPGDRPSIAEIIELCRSANAETVLRRPEDWLPAPVTADITVCTAAPAPVQTPPPPSSAPSVAYSPTTPVAPATAPSAYSPTAPAGYGPARDTTAPSAPSPRTTRPPRRRLTPTRTPRPRSRTGAGYIGIVTVRGFPSEDSPSTYMPLDLTVWRNAVSSGSGS
ncbi:protein kinase domain-containing protein [Streptomyces sp. NBC_01618]|uniref:protein kinase domain-containing protein n=1 Tax=Streptomyces sp. NBC_01618 TaxID=2975900 RepID=UPI00386B73F7|nr:hypothetical protein OH735_35760 [Streptomyces sp. NBC_01618]